jgi:hypothetical protein
MALAATLAGLSILIIGDSHLSDPRYLIGSLQDDLVRQGAKVHSIGVCGVEPADWTMSVAGKCGGAERIGSKPAVVSDGSDAHTTPVTQLIQSERPNLVLIVMGDTTAAYQQSDFPMNWAWQQVTTLTGAIAQTGTRCAWVGPAWGQEGGKFGKTYARAEVMSQFLAVNVTPCTFIDSQKMSARGQWPTVDGQHFTPAGYRSWGDAIARSVIRLPGLSGTRP